MLSVEAGGVRPFQFLQCEKLKRYMALSSRISQVFFQFPSNSQQQFKIWSVKFSHFLQLGVNSHGFAVQKAKKFIIFSEKARGIIPMKKVSCPNDMTEIISSTDKGLYNEKSKKTTQKARKEHHLWQKRESTKSGQKALNLVRIISALPNEKEAVYGALDKWIAWEAEFPLIAAAKALRILRRRNQWVRLIQVAKWMLSKGQGATMATYDSLLLAFDMDQRVDEAEMLWNMILHTHTRSISKQLFSRMISLYDHHSMPEKIIQRSRL